MCPVMMSKHCCSDVFFFYGIRFNLGVFTDWKHWSIYVIITCVQVVNTDKTAWDTQVQCCLFILEGGGGSSVERFNCPYSTRVLYGISSQLSGTCLLPHQWRRLKTHTSVPHIYYLNLLNFLVYAPPPFTMDTPGPMQSFIEGHAFLLSTLITVIWRLADCWPLDQTSLPTALRHLFFRCHDTSRVSPNIPSCPGCWEFGRGPHYWESCWSYLGILLTSCGRERHWPPCECCCIDGVFLLQFGLGASCGEGNSWTPQSLWA